MNELDLDGYLDRIGIDGDPTPDLGSLRALHAAHLASIPFENLDVRLGRPIRLDLEALQEKMVRRRRGGYCFEQNGLFAAALRQVGFTVDTLEARVRPPGVTAVLPRTHMTLRVTVDGSHWLADVGFGGDGPPSPVPFDPPAGGAPEPLVRIARESGGVHVLRSGETGEWRDLYAFTLVPALPVDYEVANHFTSTHPRSVFVNTLTVQRTTARGRFILRGRTYVERIDGEETSREVDEAAAFDLLRDRFGLEVSREEVRRALG